MLRSMLRLRRSAAVLLLACCAVTLSLVSGASAGALAGQPARVAAAEYDIAQETLEDLADVEPGDRVEVVIQSTLPAGSMLMLQYPAICPVPFPGTPSATYPNDVCVNTDRLIDIPPQGVFSDPNGRFEFTLTVPHEGDNVFRRGERNEFSCAPGDTCSLGFTFAYILPGTTAMQPVYDVASLAFTPKQPGGVEGCEAPEPGRYVDALGPFRLRDAQVGWVTERCAEGARQDLDYTTMSDAEARNTFLAGGTGDVFFGAGGVAAYEDLEDAGRTAVPVPVAVNAQVLAITGKYPAGSSVPNAPRPAALTDVRLTAEQFADILVRNDTALHSGPHAEGALQANPQLASVSSAKRQAVSTAAYATPEVGHWLMSRYMSAHAESAWWYPDQSQYDRPGAAIGELWRLEPLVPGGGDREIALAADRVSLGKLLESEGFLGDCTVIAAGCVNFVLTDAATAADLKLPVAKIENAAGEFVAPTPQSMTAAVEGMDRRPGGTLVPDPRNDDPAAYPLTFVEYAHASAEAEVDDQCWPTDRQQTINDVLSYLVNGGQDRLSAGLLPLPPALSQPAGHALEQVGARAPDCPGDEPVGGDGDGAGGGTGGGEAGTPTAASGGGDLGGGAGIGDASTTSAGAEGDHDTRPVTDEGQENALRAASDTQIPLFTGMAALVLIVPLGALMLTNALTSGTAYGSSGRAWPPWAVKALAVAVAYGAGAKDRAVRSARRIPQPGQRGKA